MQLGNDLCMCWMLEMQPFLPLTLILTGLGSSLISLNQIKAEMLDLLNPLDLKVFSMFCKIEIREKENKYDVS